MLCPPVCYDDMRGGWFHLVLVVLASLSFICLLFYLAHLPAIHERRQQESLEAFLEQDPQQMAREAIQNGDLRYLGLPARQTGAASEKPGGISIPGVGEFDELEANGPDYRPISGLHRLSCSTKEDLQYQRAQIFAGDYNQVLSTERERQGL